MRIGVAFRQLDPSDEIVLGSFFEAVSRDPTALRFRPHPFTVAQAKIVANYSGRDAYFGAWADGKLCGYGMLRGWDAGHAIPSLGIYVAPSARGTGLSGELMGAMHTAAREAGAERVRLRVAPDNAPARRLYEKCGYQFDATIERGELVGIKPLTS